MLRKADKQRRSDPPTRSGMLLRIWEDTTKTRQQGTVPPAPSSALLLFRRTLAALAATAFVLLAGCRDSEPVVFAYGVASGDVTPKGAVLWTRADREATLTVEVSRDRAFEDLAVEQEVKATEERDFTVKASVDGLKPDTRYYYRFRKGDGMSATGTFRTAPTEDETAPVRFVFSGDSDATVSKNGKRAFDFKVLDTMRAENPDFFLYFGDTIYADSSAGPKAETLAAYRAKYKEARSVARLRQILAATSVYSVWDDHEVENDFAGTTVDPDLLSAGRQAFREYLPLRDAGASEVLYRRFRWGAAVELIILDERSFRDDDVAQACTPLGAEAPDLLPGLGTETTPDPYRSFREFIGLPEETDQACLDALNDPGRTMLGEEQKQFLLNALETSDATFKFIVNQVPITELIALPYDRWEGYRAERDELLRFLGDHKIENVVFLTTDLHANIISDVRVNLASPPVAVEAITGPIAHQTLGDAIAEEQGENAIGAFEALLVQVPRVECVELDAFSYGLVEVDPEAGAATITLKDETGEELCKRVLKAL